MDAKTLSLRIAEAFDAGPPPAERPSSAAEPPDFEAEEIRRALASRPWRDVPFETLNDVVAAWPFLTPAEYRYYLPAFMTFVVIAFDDANPVPDEIVRSLTYPALSDLERTRELAELNPEVQPFSLEQWESIVAAQKDGHTSGVLEQAFLRRVTGFNDQQNQVIREFLEYLSDTHGGEFPDSEPQVAIDRYWKYAAARSPANSRDG